MSPLLVYLLFFFFNDTATTEIYTLSYTTLFRSPAEERLEHRPQVPPGLLRAGRARRARDEDRKSTRLNSSHGYISYAVFCLKKKKNTEGSAAATIPTDDSQSHALQEGVCGTALT